MCDHLCNCTNLSIRLVAYADVVFFMALIRFIEYLLLCVFNLSPPR